MVSAIQGDSERRHPSMMSTAITEPSTTSTGITDEAPSQR